MKLMDVPEISGTFILFCAWYPGIKKSNDG